MKSQRTILVVVSFVLIFEFGARLLFPAHETESFGLSLLRLLFDCGMVIGLVGTCFQILKSAPRPANAMGPWMVLPAIGFVAGLGLFVIRLSGGPGVELPTRPTQSSTPSSMFPPDLEELGKKMAR